MQATDDIPVYSFVQIPTVGQSPMHKLPDREMDITHPQARAFLREVI